MYICHWAEAELSQKKTVKSRSQTLKTIKEITKKTSSSPFDSSFCNKRGDIHYLQSKQRF